MVSLVFAVLTLNSVQTRSISKERAFLDVTQAQINQVVTAIAPYTPVIEEDPQMIEASLRSRQDGYFAPKQDFVKTIVQPLSYTVQKGDTISSIAEHFKITVATILEANQISPLAANSLTPGRVLTIPTETTSRSIAWLEEINKVKQEQQKREEAKRKLALAQRSTATRDSSKSRQAVSPPADVEGYITPLDYRYLSRGISRRHAGLDLIASSGQPVWAAQDCKVTKADRSGWNGGFGKHVVCQDSQGNRANYAHLSEVSVNEGDVLTKGDLLGRVGSTGRSTAPHLHLEVRASGGRVINPLDR